MFISQISYIISIFFCTADACNVYRYVLFFICVKHIHIVYATYLCFLMNDSIPCFSKTVLLTTREAAWYIISVVSVCMYVCQTINFYQSLDVGSSYLHIRYNTTGCGSRSYMKVIGSRSKKVQIPYSRNVKLRSAITLIP